MIEVTEASIAELRAALEAGTTTAVELVDAYDSPAMTMDDYLLALTRAGVPKFADAVRARLY